MNGSASATVKPPVRTSSKILKEVFFQLALPLGFAVIVLFFFPLRASFEFSFDEGVNLMKSMLMSKGYHLYGEIWSDQPPLFNYLLAEVIKLTGTIVAPSRIVVLLFSCALMWAAIQFMRLGWGDGPALISAVLLFFLPRYFFLSFAVMIGLPAISLAMVSLLFLACWHIKGQWVWLVLSALFLALSVLTKLFTGLLAPIFIAGIIIQQFNPRKDKIWLRKLFPAVVWGVVFGLLGLCIGLLLVRPQYIPQLLETHLAATTLIQFDKPEFTLTYQLRAAVPILILAVVGTIFAIREKRWLLLYLSFWSAIAYLTLFRHKPIWEHHQLLITIPAALMASVALYKLFSLAVQLVRANLEPNFTNLLMAVSLVAFAVYFFPFSIQDPLYLLSPTPSLQADDLGLGPNYDKALRIVFKYAPKSQWMVTDLPMFAYRAGLLVPPNMAVFTAKRYASGFITGEEVIRTIQEYQPEQILLGRYEYPLVDSFLATQNYRMVHQVDQIKVYIRNDLLQ